MSTALPESIIAFDTVFCDCAEKLYRSCRHAGTSSPRGRPRGHRWSTDIDTKDFTTLISGSDVAGLLDNPNLRIVDCRFDLARAEAGQQAYRHSHLPGAVYAHLHRDLAAPVTEQTGRHPLPDPDHFAALLGRWGIGPDSQVVVYDDGLGNMAARLWWMLRWLGHDRVALLDGGFSTWQAAGRPVDSDPARYPPTRFTARPRQGMHMDTQQVARGLAEDTLLLVDLRVGPRFLGEVEPLDDVAGHVPGAVNLPFETHLGPDGLFRPTEQLAALYSELMAAHPGKQICFMCGSGVSACHGLLAAAVAGIPGGRLYPGSWSEWIRDPNRPVARGPATGT